MKQQPTSNIANPEQEEQIISDSSIRIGEVWLQSSEANINELASIMVGLLQTPSVQEYLDLIKKERKINRASYVD